MLELFENPLWLAGVAGVFGAAIGSFLNVVILRLPKMMENGWLIDSREFLGIEAPPPEPISLIYPHSCCTQCKAPIKPWHNVPILGWLALRGRAACCGTPISAQYPIVEAACAVLSAVCAVHFGPTPALLGALVVTWYLLALAMIDLNTQLLPDSMTLPLMWMGLLASLWQVFTTPEASIIGAVAGYLSLWSVAKLFKLIRGVDGMAAGDFKLLGALGAWMGWKALPEVILLSSLVGAVCGVLLVAFRGQDRSVPIPFGPYLAGAGWLALLWGDALRDGYFRFAGIHS